MEQTLHICREVSVYKIPPRSGRGHISGEWRVEDKLSLCRLRVVAVRGDGSEECVEVRLEDPNNGEIFGVCPVPRGQASTAVEQAVDSSRNFAIRLEDPATKRHAFVGISFAERTAAFDFNVALADFERQLQREKHISRISAASDREAAAESVLPEAAALYRSEDLRLREGESMKIEVKKKPSAGGGGFLSRLGTSGPTQPAATKLALPPLVAPLPQPSNRPGQQGGAAQPAGATVVASTEENWATF